MPILILCGSFVATCRHGASFILMHIFIYFEHDNSLFKIPSCIIKTTCYNVHIYLLFFYFEHVHFYLFLPYIKHVFRTFFFTHEKHVPPLSRKPQITFDSEDDYGSFRITLQKYL